MVISANFVLLEFFKHLGLCPGFKKILIITIKQAIIIVIAIIIIIIFVHSTFFHPRELSTRVKKQTIIHSCMV